MSLILDHVFVLTQPGALAASRLIDLGLKEGPFNVHPGQGTANRRFFFQGFTIELLYISDADEALNGAGRVLGLAAREADEGASPFGIVVRVPTPDSAPAFPNWLYYPDYFGGKLCFHVGENAQIRAEPLCICMPPALPKAAPAPGAPLNDEWHLTSLEISLPVREPSTTLRHFETLKQLSLILDQPHGMSMTFNQGVSNQLADLRPELPLTIRW